MIRSRKSLLEEAAGIEKQIEKGKIKGKKTLKDARWKISHLKWRAKKKAAKAAEKRDNSKIAKDVTKSVSRAVKSPSFKKVLKNIEKSKKKQKFNPDQGFIPGFLSQMNMVRVEELVAEKIFQAFKSGEVVVQSKSKKAI